VRIADFLLLCQPQFFVECERVYFQEFWGVFEHAKFLQKDVLSAHKITSLDQSGQTTPVLKKRTLVN